ILKPHFELIRPFHQFSWTRVAERCGGLYRFPSNHASNVASVIFITLHSVSRRLWWTLLFFAVGVSYSRVYLGKHMPSSILGGRVLGGAVGYVVPWLRAKLPHQIPSNAWAAARPIVGAPGHHRESRQTGQR